MSELTGRLKAIESIEHTYQIVDKLKGFFQSQAGECAVALDELDEALTELKGEQDKIEGLESRLDGVKQLLLGGDKEKEKDNATKTL